MSLKYRLNAARVLRIFSNLARYECAFGYFLSIVAVAIPRRVFGSCAIRR